MTDDAKIDIEVNAVTAKLLTGTRVRHVPTGRYCRFTGEVSYVVGYYGWYRVVMEDNGLDGLLKPGTWEPA